MLWVSGDPNPTPHHTGPSAVEDTACPSGSFPQALEIRKAICLCGILQSWSVQKLKFPEGLKVLTSVFSSCSRQRGQQGQLPPPAWLEDRAAACSENSRALCINRITGRDSRTHPGDANVAGPGGASRSQAREVKLGFALVVKDEQRKSCRGRRLSQTRSSRGGELPGSQEPWALG